MACVPPRPATGLRRYSAVTVLQISSAGGGGVVLPATVISVGSSCHMSSSYRHDIIPSCPRPHSRRGQRPVHSNLRARPSYSNSLRRRGGHGVASRRGADVAVGACIQARLEAGNCEEGFVCLFQGRPYSRIRSALAVPCFFVAGCPRRVCRNPPTCSAYFGSFSQP